MTHRTDCRAPPGAVWYLARLSQTISNYFEIQQFNNSLIVNPYSLPPSPSCQVSPIVFLLQFLQSYDLTVTLCITAGRSYDIRLDRVGGTHEDTRKNVMGGSPYWTSALDYFLLDTLVVTWGNCYPLYRHGVSSYRLRTTTATLRLWTQGRSSRLDRPIIFSDFCQAILL